MTSAAGSCLVACGRTRVLCTASVDESVPGWLSGRGQGWLTAEYAMLPGSTDRRKPREGRRGVTTDGRTVEIQRLVGRSLRPVVDLKRLGERTVTLDCDVLEADGGTRTTAINGAFVALSLAVASLRKEGKVGDGVIRSHVGAISVGIVGGEVLVDLDYSEDRDADADLNVVMNDAGELIEVQGTGERRAFTRAELDAALDVATGGIQQVFVAQSAVLEAAS